MRTVRFSKSFRDQLTDAILAGALRFGDRVALRKKQSVLDTILTVIADNPALKRRDDALGLVIYPIRTTPFFVVYDYDDAEVRVLFLFIRGKSLDDIDPSSVEW